MELARGGSSPGQFHYKPFMFAQEVFYSLSSLSGN
jgi:hypothetical protein